MKSPCSKMHIKAKQRGVILMIVAAVLVLAGLTMLLTMLDDTTVDAKRNQKTAEALALAKEALIGYSVKNNNRPGSLPCPDRDNDGDADLLNGHICPAYIGRVPWKTFGLSDLRDGQGERLWYALSPNFTDSLFLSNGTTPPARVINNDTPGQIVITGSSPASNVVAIIFSAGAVIGAQQRDSANPSAAINNEAANFLEGENATGGVTYTESFLRNVDTIGDVTYQTGAASLTFNDRLLAISEKDLMPPIEKRIAREAKICLDDYAASAGGKYPWAVKVANPTVFTQLVMGQPTVSQVIVGDKDTLFGRFSALPSTQSWASNATVVTMQTKFAELWAAVHAFRASKTQTNYNNLLAAADPGAKDAANNVKTAYSGTALETPADNMQIAANEAKSIALDSTNAFIDAKLQALVNASNAFAAAFSGGNGMPGIWPTSCTLFSSGIWNHWKNFLFYQVADGFKPGGSGSCTTGTCLTINSAGAFRAVVVVAGRALAGQSPRAPTVSPPSTYLEGINPHSGTTPPIAFETYNLSGSGYSTVNDLVLCLDAKANCK